ncbi:unnamed protein product [marine sediment metagenome]|uniref:Enolpyruvate transferase domain-containing protein n=1 Tax=marine sediment metagenome TaxID=412755 RepID=X1Q601_9ZZZZ
MPKITVLSKTIKTDKMPDVHGFTQSMKDMGAKVSTKEGTIVIDLRHLGGSKDVSQAQNR